MPNGLSCDFSSLTQLLPDFRPVDRTNKLRAIRSLRSSLITRLSSLLRTGPPATLRDGTQLLAVLPLGVLPLAARQSVSQLEPPPANLLARYAEIVEARTDEAFD